MSITKLQCRKLFKQYIDHVTESSSNGDLLNTDEV